MVPPRLHGRAHAGGYPLNLRAVLESRVRRNGFLEIQKWELQVAMSERVLR